MVGVKGQSNLEIARTPRNAFRCSLESSFAEVELLIRLEGFIAYQTLTNSECCKIMTRSEAMGAKIRGQKGNNPDHQLRSPSIC